MLELQEGNRNKKNPSDSSRVPEEIRTLCLPRTSKRDVA
jgi:hypothetical protein